LIFLYFYFPRDLEECLVSKRLYHSFLLSSKALFCIKLYVFGNWFPSFPLLSLVLNPLTDPYLLQITTSLEMKIPLEVGYFITSIFPCTDWYSHYSISFFTNNFGSDSSSSPSACIHNGLKNSYYCIEYF
jgi:hypothetical protein